MTPARRRRARALSVFAAAFLLAILLAVVSWELRTSRLQAWVLSRYARRLTYASAPGPSPAIRFPRHGPYDQRLGYAELPRFVERLQAQGFGVYSQARISPPMQRLADGGYYLPYREKSQAGLRVVDEAGVELYSGAYPQRVLGSLREVPAVVVRTLLFVENRELLSPGPWRNPAVEWDRLALSILSMGWRRFDADQPVPGASTLATQLVKLRHSPGGVTASPKEKLRQMLLASLHAYRGGENTTPARRRIVTEYLDSMPLAAVPDYGEVTGLGDGLHYWWGADLSEVTRRLRRVPDGPLELATWAGDYRKVLSLILAQRRPTYYLVQEPAALETRTDSYLRLLVGAGILTPEQGEAALAVRPARRVAPDLANPLAPDRKTVGVLRNRLVSMLEVSQLYDVDRLDLTVTTTLDGVAQRAVGKALSALSEPAVAAAAGLRAPRLLQQGEPAGVTYSFVLYENTRDGAVLRVQADNSGQPLNVSEGGLLELGSSAKLRTLVAYLEVVAELQEELLRRAGAEPPARQDPLTRWAAAYMASAADPSLAAMLEAALERSYSASPAERFVTGGGIHIFANFDPDDDGRVMSVRQAFRNSINLVFVRLMRDLVEYHVQRRADVTALLRDVDASARQSSLERFAELEGAEFVRRFYRRYGGRSAAGIRAQVVAGRTSPEQAVAVLRYLAPAATAAEMAPWLADALPDQDLSEARLGALYDRHRPDAWTLMDRAFLGHMHPLELWVAARLHAEPALTLEELLPQSVPTCREVYTWLYRSTRKASQDARIRALQELDAFTEIHGRWQRLGYPLPRLVPSLGTAVGSSGDRPAALAQLVGVLLNDGILVRPFRASVFHFAAGTPYETLLTRRRPAPERVLRSEVASAVVAELDGVVEAGTGRRVHDAFTGRDGRSLRVGGKTGTGDNRREAFDGDGRLLRSDVTSRTAVFAFHIGERFYGAISAHVLGPEAAGYRFTSALPLEVLRYLAPCLAPLLQRAAEQSGPG
ncbi:MAG: transglycosylase domain-containing protein [Gemmatimonadota bacterium]